MIGAIIGDIAGSVYEFNNEKDKQNIAFFGDGHKFTDDSVLTIATADWILHGGDIASYYAKYGLKYRASYGGRFRSWLQASRDGVASPYNSFGNGSAMRVSPVAWAFDTEEEVLQKAKESAECTHNHPDGIAGAQAIALCIFMARKGKTKDEIRQAVEQRFYPLDFTTDEIRPSYGWRTERFGNSVWCSASVPPAIVAFLDSTDFVDCIRTAISLGGDSDTIAAMAGSIAQAYYGVPAILHDVALQYLDSNLRDVVLEFEEKYVISHSPSHTS